MISSGNLRTFGQAVAKAEEDIYLPGEMIPEDGYLSVVNEPGGPRMMFDSPWEKPKSTRGIPGTRLDRFKTGISLRRGAKMEIFRKLDIIPSSHIPNGPNYSSVDELPSGPTYFVDGVPNYDEVGFGQGDLVSDVQQGPTRNWWGGLETAIVDLSNLYFRTQSAPYEAQIKTSEAQIKASVIPPQSTITKYIPYLIGGGVLFLLLKKGGKKE